MPKITLIFDSSWAKREYEAEGEYWLYEILEELLHRLTVNGKKMEEVK